MNATFSASYVGIATLIIPKVSVATLATHRDNRVHALYHHPPGLRFLLQVTTPKRLGKRAYSIQ